MVVLLDQEDGGEQDHQQSRPVGSDEVGRVASVLVATAVLDEDVECSRALEAVFALSLSLTTEPAATPNETIVIPHFLYDLAADRGFLVGIVFQFSLVAVCEGKCLVPEGISAVSVVVRVAFPALDGAACLDGKGECNEERQP